MTVYGKVLIFIIALDTVTTVLGIHFGVLSEGNPLMLSMMERIGILWTIAFKFAVAIFAIALLEILHQRGGAYRARARIYYYVAIVGYVALYVAGFLAINLA